MADLSIRSLDDGVRELLRRRAASHGRSMEAEIRAILTEAVLPRGAWLPIWHQRFHEVGGVDLEVPPRATARRAPSYDS